MWKIMIADDEVFIRDGLKKLIQWERLGCELLYSARNGKDLLDYFNVYVPDIVIVDIKMPIMNGLEVISHLKDNYPKVKVILLTAYADFEYAKQGIQYGINDYIIKTSILEELPSAISGAVKQLEECKMKEKSIPQGEKLFLRVLIEESIIPDDYYFECKEYYESFQENFSPFCLIVLQIVNENTQFDNNLQKSIFDLMESAFDGNIFKAFVVSQTEYCIIIQGEEEKKGKLIFLSNKLRSLCNNFLGVKIVIGLSQFYSNIGQVSLAYNRTLKNIMNNFDRGDTAVFYDENNNMKVINRNQLSYLIDDIVKNVEMAKNKESLDSLENLMKAFEESELSSVKSALIVLLSGCRKICREQAIDLDKEIFEERNVDSEILNINNIAELRDIFIIIISKTVESVGGQKERRDDLIKQIDNYINKNYCKRLTLDEIAAEIHVNPSYLSRIYKAKTGMNLFDLVNIKKVEKAKEYIINYNKKIHEVANLVGFSDSAYFSRVFKKYTGYTPKEFNRMKGDIK